MIFVWATGQLVAIQVPPTDTTYLGSPLPLRFEALKIVPLCSSQSHIFPLNVLAEEKKHMLLRTQLDRRRLRALCGLLQAPLAPCCSPLYEYEQNTAC